MTPDFLTLSSMDSSWPAERCLEAEVPHASKTNFEMTGVTSASSKMGGDENIQSTIHGGQVVW